MVSRHLRSAAGFTARPDGSCAGRRGLLPPGLRASLAAAPRAGLAGLHSASRRLPQPSHPPPGRQSGCTGCKNRPAGRTSCGRARASPPSGHPGRDNSGGRAGRSHLPDGRRTARHRQARPALPGQQPPRPRPRRTICREPEGGAAVGPGPPPPRPALPEPGKRAELGAARGPRVPLASRGCADGRYFLLPDPSGLCVRREENREDTATLGRSGF